MPLRPEFLDLPFNEAVAYFRRKILIPTTTCKQFTAAQHNYCFTIAGLTKASLLEDARQLVDKALAEGTDLETFKKEFQQKIIDKWWKADGKRVETILSTNVRRSYAAGRYQQATDPDIMRDRPLLLWRHRYSPNFRPNHLALHNVAIPTDHEFWKVALPPCAWGCRCSFNSISLDYAKRKGIKILNNPPDPLTIADPEFQRAPGMSLESDRASVLENGLSRLSPELRSAIKNEQ